MSMSPYIVNEAFPFPTEIAGTFAQRSNITTFMSVSTSNGIRQEDVHAFIQNAISKLLIYFNNKHVFNTSLLAFGRQPMVPVIQNLFYHNLGLLITGFLLVQVQTNEKPYNWKNTFTQTVIDSWYLARIISNIICLFCSLHLVIIKNPLK